MDTQLFLAPSSPASTLGYGTCDPAQRYPGPSNWLADHAIGVTGKQIFGPFANLVIEEGPLTAALAAIPVFGQAGIGMRWAAARVFRALGGIGKTRNLDDLAEFLRIPAESDILVTTYRYEESLSAVQHLGHIPAEVETQLLQLMERAVTEIDEMVNLGVVSRETGAALEKAFIDRANTVAQSPRLNTLLNSTRTGKHAELAERDSYLAQLGGKGGEDYVRNLTDCSREIRERLAGGFSEPKLQAGVNKWLNQFDNHLLRLRTQLSNPTIAGWHAVKEEFRNLKQQLKALNLVEYLSKFERVIEALPREHPPIEVNAVRW